MNQNVLQRLREPFAFKDVEWKVQITTQDKAKGMAVAYIDSRAIQNRLDEAIGAFNWQNSFIPWHGNSQLCGISVYDEERGDWITKYDGAENTDIEPIKGGLSDSTKRAACLWGIGRYLYEIPSIWVEIEQRGKSSVIKDNQYSKLEAEYNKAVARMFGGSQPKAPVVPIQQQPSAPVHQQPPAPVEQKAPASIEQQASQETKQPVSSEYRVQSVKPSGRESQLLELLTSEGEVVSAYVKNSDEGIKVGSRLQNVAMVQKQSSYGQYNLINGYQIAA